MPALPPIACDSYSRTAGGDQVHRVINPASICSRMPGLNRDSVGPGHRARPNERGGAAELVCRRLWWRGGCRVSLHIRVRAAGSNDPAAQKHWESESMTRRHTPVGKTRYRTCIPFFQCLNRRPIASVVTRTGGQSKMVDQTWKIPSYNSGVRSARPSWPHGQGPALAAGMRLAVCEVTQPPARREGARPDG